MPDIQKGSCLCGAVKFEAALKAQEAVVCHCRMCRKWGSGGPAISVECDADIKIEKPENLTWYESSKWAERGFCNKCGSGLFYRFKNREYANVSAAVLDDESRLKLALHVFSDSKPDYYDFSDTCKRMTGAEVIAQYSK